MVWIRVLCVSCVWTVCGITHTALAQPTDGGQLSIGPVAGQQLTAIDGAPYQLGPGTVSRFQVVCFIGTECPLAKLYGSRLQTLADRYAAAGVSFVGVGSNRQDSVAELAEYAERHALSFPLVKDHGNRLADQFSATRTPEVVVLDAAGTIRYRGRIDDQYEPGIVRNEPKSNDLEAAIEALLAGQQPPRVRTQAVGCIIGREPTASSSGQPASGQPAEITFTRDVAPILQTHCLSCHREGQIGPFALDEYDEVVGWGEMILEVIDQGRMPPWHAAPPHDRFVGARHLPTEEVELLRRWVALGMPEGEPQDLPPAPQFVAGWALPREPDEVLEMAAAPMEVPATGTVDYQYFVVDPGWKEERWIQAAEVVPGNSRVVHHAICFVRPPDGGQFNGIGWLAAYVPGQRPAVLPTGAARRVQAGSKLVFQMHYTPTGRPETDISRIGLLFADPEEVTTEVQTRMAINQSFEIPPEAERHPVRGYDRGFADGDLLLSLMPHMHYRGSEFMIYLTDSAELQESFMDETDGLAQPQLPSPQLPSPLLRVPNYDFNWQHDYRLVEPVALSSQTRLLFTAVFDNSIHNPFNPDPTKHVSWGDQSWEEMAVAFYDIARPRRGVSEGERLIKRDRSEEQVSAELAERRAAFVDDFFARFDANQDGVIERSETPTAVAAFGFWSLDINNDRVLDRDEISRAAAARIRN